MPVTRTLLVAAFFIASLSIASADPAIVYSQANQDGVNGHAALRNHLFCCNADGSGQIQLTSGDYSDTLPIWSPNGKWILFRREEMTLAQTTTQVCVIPGTGGSVTNLLTWNDTDKSTYVAQTMAWMPDSRHFCILKITDNGSFSDPPVNSLVIDDMSLPANLKSVSSVKYFSIAPDYKHILLIDDPQGNGAKGRVATLGPDGAIGRARSVESLTDETAWISPTHLGSIAQDGSAITLVDSASRRKATIRLRGVPHVDGIIKRFKVVATTHLPNTFILGLQDKELPCYDLYMADLKTGVATKIADRIANLRFARESNRFVATRFGQSTHHIAFIAFNVGIDPQAMVTGDVTTSRLDILVGGDAVVTSADWR